MNSAAGVGQKTKKMRARKKNPGMPGHARRPMPQGKKQSAQRRPQGNTALYRIEHRWKKLKKAESGTQQNDTSKCPVCFLHLLKKERKDHYMTEFHKEASEFKKRCMWEGRFAPTLEEQIEKINRERAEFERENDKQNKDGEKVPSEGTTDQAGTNEGSYEIGAPNVEAPDKAMPNLEAPDMVAPDVDLPDKVATDNEAPDKDSSNKGIYSKKQLDNERLKEVREKFYKQIASIGLEYVLQYLPNEEGKRVYVCKLCKGVFWTRTIYYHIQSVQHRIMYLAKHHSDMAINMNFQVNTQNKYKQLTTCAQNVEKNFGQKRVVVINKVYVPKPEPEELKGNLKQANALPMECDVHYRTDHLDNPYLGNSSGAFHKALRGDPRYHQDAEFSRLGYAESMRMEREPFRESFSHHNIEERFLESGGPRQLASMNQEEPWLQRSFSDGRRSVSKQDPMMRRPASDGQYSMSQEDLMMSCHSGDGQYPMGREDLMMPCRSGDGQYPMSREDRMRHRCSGDGQYPMSQEDRMMSRCSGDGQYPMRQEDMMMRRPSCDGQYPMSQEDLMMRRPSGEGQYSRSQEDMMMRRRCGDCQCPMSQEDLMMRRPSGDGQYSRSQEDVMFTMNHAFLDSQAGDEEGAEFQRGFNNGRPTMNRDVGPLRQPNTGARTRLNQDASTMRRGANDARPTMRARGAMKPPVHGSAQALAVSESENTGLIPVARAVPSAISQQLEALRRAAVAKPYTKGDRGKTFTELKAAHGGEKRELKKSRWAPVEGHKEKDVNDLEEFWCNDELYDFLANFVVESKEDVEYVLKITDSFAQALVKHKKRTDEIKAKILEEKKKLEAEKKAFLCTPGVNKALQSIKERAKSPPNAAPNRSQVTAEGGKQPKRHRFSEDKQVQPKPQPRQMFGAAPVRPQGPLTARANPSQQAPAIPINQSGVYANPRSSLGQNPNGPSGFISSMQPTSSLQTLGPNVNRQDSLNEMRPSFSESRPTLLEQQRPTLNQPKPTINESRIRVSKWSQPFDQSKSSTIDPPMQDLRPPMMGSRPPWHEQKPPLDQPRPTLNESRPMSEPRSGMHDSRQQFESKPTYGEMRSSLNESRPPEPRQPFSDSRLPKTRSTFGDSRPPDPRQNLSDSRPAGPISNYSDSRTTFSESRLSEMGPPFSESRPPESRQSFSESWTPFSDSRPSELRLSFSGSRPQDSMQPYSESRPPFTGSRPPESRQPFSELRPPFTGSRPSELKPPFSESRTSEPRPPFNQSKPPAQKQTLSESRLSFGVSKPLEGRQPYSESRPPVVRQPYSDSKPPQPRPLEPKELYGGSRPPEARQPLIETRLPEPKLPLTESKPPEPRESKSALNESRSPINEASSHHPRLHINEQTSFFNQTRLPLNQQRPPFIDQSSSFSQPRPPFNAVRPPLNQPRPSYGTSERFTDPSYNQNERDPSSQFGNNGYTGGPRPSYGPVTGGNEGYMSSYSYGQQYSESSYSSPYSFPRPPFGSTTNKPPGPPSQSPGSMVPPYNTYQNQWPSQMPPRADTYRPEAQRDSTTDNRFPTGYQASQGATKYS